MVDIEQLLVRLDAVSDRVLHSALEAEQLEISEDKYITAFSCMAAAFDLRIVDPFAMPTPPQDDPHLVKLNLERASIVFITFTTLMYMRSDHLERGLDKVQDGSPLREFREVFRAGCAKQGEDTLAQHLRNSLAHGTFYVAQDKLEVTFVDRGWRMTIGFDQLWRFCNHVYRLYHEAFRFAPR